MIKFSDRYMPSIVSLNISPGGIPKLPIESVEVTSAGLAGDGHNHSKHYRPEQAVSLQDVEKLAELQSEGFALSCGATGENINVCGLNVNALVLGTVLNFSGGVKLEISKVRNPCYVLDAINPKLKEVIINRCGMYAKVLKEGTICIGEIIHISVPSPTIS